MKIIATRTLTWSALVGLYAVSPLAGIAALAAGFGFMARGVYSPVRVRQQ
jgi:uncharacterized membrane protein HdeD (DUF308 family)